MKKPLFTVQETCELFRIKGHPMSLDKLREGIKSGVYPFGKAILLNDWTFDIYRIKVYDYLKDIGVEITEDEVWSA